MGPFGTEGALLKIWPTLRHILVGEAVVLDEAGNVLCMQGDAHMTISAHVGMLMAAGKWNWFCYVAWFAVEDVAAFFDPALKGHFQRAWAAEKPIWAASKDLPGG